MEPWLDVPPSVRFAFGASKGITSARFGGIRESLQVALTFVVFRFDINVFRDFGELDYWLLFSYFSLDLMINKEFHNGGSLCVLCCVVF